ncbi:uncharacterized protein LOC121409618 [Lytechinus variegatus]|uniref:uncharacterized protein LOC121409618 n=1 Tax=Lytechinus variegatus TaxID=7654 RepID=UPI001BB203D4|nr:uncharacterized protein LOC121409618 [Lytechinus variegatus]
MDPNRATTNCVFSIHPSHLCILILSSFLLLAVENGAKPIKPLNCSVTAVSDARSRDLSNLEDCYLLDKSKMPIDVTDCVRENGMSDLCLSFGTGRGLAPTGLIACFTRYKTMINNCRNDTSPFVGQLVDVKTMMRCRFRPSLVQVTTPKKFSFFF